MVTNTYGNFNPAGIEPYPIETKLAELASTSPAEAQMMLNSYTAQRQATAGQYTNELDQQHEVAKQQIAAQMADARMKAFTGVTHDPGALALAASSPQLSNMIGLDTADPAVLHGIIGQQTRLQNATIAEKGGAAGASLTAAGAQPSSDQFGQLTGLQNLNVGDPVAIQAAKIAAAARIAAAVAGRQPKEPPGIGVSIPLPANPQLGGLAGTASIPGKLGVSQGVAQLRAQGLIPPEIDVGGGGGAGGSGTTSAPTPRTATNLLPMAKTDTPANNAPSNNGMRVVPLTVPKAKELSDKIRDTVNSNVSGMPPDQVARVKQAMAGNNGNPIIAVDGQGKPHLLDAQGKVIR